MENNKLTREIKFRGKVTSTNTWVYGSLEVRPKIDFYGIIYEGNLYPVMNESIGQFTGIVDKTGNAIYEGDIVRTESGRLCVVVWFNSDSYAGWDLAPICTKENLKYNPPIKYLLWASSCLEVVGNIFENSELLTDKE